MKASAPWSQKTWDSILDKDCSDQLVPSFRTGATFIWDRSTGACSWTVRRLEYVELYPLHGEALGDRLQTIPF